ncbi:MAG TPA: hypothetical protein VFV64_03315 [Permianibacter sp.]|nr:hypothetical protein [Permianibacter sp.]
MHVDKPALALLAKLQRRYALRTAVAVALCTAAPLLIWLFATPSRLLLLLLPLAVAAVAAKLAWQEAERLLANWLDDAIAPLQDSSFLLTATPQSAIAALQQQRVHATLLQQLTELPPVLPAVLPRSAYGLSAGVTALSLLLWWWQMPVIAPPVAANSVRVDAVSALPPAVIVRVTPPGYTGQAPFESPGGDIKIAEGSSVQFCLLATVEQQAQLSVQWLDGETRPLSVPATHGDRVCNDWTFTFSTGFRVLSHGEPVPGLQGRLLLQRDQAPQITVRQPERELQDVDSGEYVLPLQLDVADDYGLYRASLHWTLARGGGENVRFTDREQRLPVGADPRRWLHEQSLRLRQLGMEPGDELYFYVVAEDNHQPVRQQSRSRTYILRHPVEQEGSDAGARLPADLGKAKFRSQRQIILDTEALISQRKQLSAQQFRERSEKLAQDQMILRLRYGEFLGEESSFEAATPAAEDDAKEHGSDAADAEHGHGDHDDHGAAPMAVGIAARAQVNVLTTYGHAHDEAENATLFDEATKTILRRALRAMWGAEGGLRMAIPEQALPEEYAALAAIKELQQAERIYLHKTAFAPPPLEESMRFSGEATDLRPVQREHLALTDAAQQRVRVLLDQLTAAEPVVDVALLDAIQQDLRARLRDSGQAEIALASLERLQQWQNGCSDCAMALRDQLAALLPTPVPAMRPQAERWQQLRAALSDERTPEPTP